ncbi:hypothetical protein [Halomonas sp. BC04]|nr:hypothetical protein [Halomonas sp. BC04]
MRHLTVGEQPMQVVVMGELPPRVLARWLIAWSGRMPPVMIDWEKADNNS